jgi:hypothetical protein
VRFMDRCSRFKPISKILPNYTTEASGILKFSFPLERRNMDLLISIFQHRAFLLHFFFLLAFIANNRLKVFFYFTMRQVYGFTGSDRFGGIRAARREY